MCLASQSMDRAAGTTRTRRGRCARHDRRRPQADGSRRSRSPARRCCGRGPADGDRMGVVSDGAVGRACPRRPLRVRRRSATNWRSTTPTTTAARMPSTGRCSTRDGSSTDCDATTAQLRCDLRDGGWPFDGTARPDDHADRVCRCTASCRSSARRPTFPAAIGWHPWFLKPERLSFRPTRDVLRRDGIGLPTAELIEPVPGPWDDTFLNDAPVALHYPGRAIASTVTVRSDCDHWVVYDQPRYATCVEPQSGPPDALDDAAARASPPDDPLGRWMEISWTLISGARLPAGNSAPIASPECHRPDSIPIPRSRSRT